MSVAVGFSAYLQDLGDNALHIHLPNAIAYPMFPAPGQPAGIFNIPALLITLAVTWVLVRGVKESAGANTTMVLIKIAAHRDLLRGSGPGDSSGQLEALRAARIPRYPHRSIARLLHLYRLRFRLHRRRGMQKPAARYAARGIILTLIVCTLLYGSVALVLTGIARYETLNNDSPVAFALKALGYNRLRLVVTFRSARRG